MTKNNNGVIKFDINGQECTFAGPKTATYAISPNGEITSMTSAVAATQYTGNFDFSQVKPPHRNEAGVTFVRTI